MEASGAPVLSTPAEHIFEAPTTSVAATSTLSDEQIYVQYEIHRTVKEIRDGRWRRIALQFPDAMLGDAPRISETLAKELVSARKTGAKEAAGPNERGEVNEVANGVAGVELDVAKQEAGKSGDEEEYITILADTSYGACCVDEVAAEHVDADVVVHYGRSCLSPTARLPVIYVFTTKPMDLDAAVAAFMATYNDPNEKVVLMADIPYQHHIQALTSKLEAESYTDIFSTTLLHDPSSPLPNRTIPDAVRSDPEGLKSFSIFHISSPPESLLLTLSSRVKAIQIFPTSSTTSAPTTLTTSTSATLRRRYALLTKVSSAPIIGILINTLSVKNYLGALAHCQEIITAAGKKSYTFVVGKLNAAKIANFAEIGGWVVIGCWESSLVESSDFYRPVVTPFELEVALTKDEERVWGGEWVSDFGALLARDRVQKDAIVEHESENRNAGTDTGLKSWEDEASDDEPPDFDLRTGKYVQSRPMGRPKTNSTPKSNHASSSVSSMGSLEAAAYPSSSLIQRAKGDVAAINGTLSPGAEYLRSQRTWQGLGSDYTVEYERDEDGRIRGAAMEEGRGGVARGYEVSGAREG